VTIHPPAREGFMGVEPKVTGPGRMQDSPQEVSDDRTHWQGTPSRTAAEARKGPDSACDLKLQVPSLNKGDSAEVRLPVIVTRTRIHFDFQWLGRST
jgi:hypothetical protein